jgi:uncharacterized protein (TIGR02246 family)
MQAKPLLRDRRRSLHFCLAFLLSFTQHVVSGTPDPNESAKPCPTKTAIVGATLINPAKAQIVDNAVVLIDGERIAAAGAARTIDIPGEAHIIEARGKWLLPGYIDAHVHFFQSGGLYTRPDVIDLRAVRPYPDETAFIKSNLADTFRRYLRNGITAVVDVGGPFWNFAVRDAASVDELAPRVAVAGPLISSVSREVLDLGDPPIVKIATPEEGRALVGRLAEQRPDLVKIWYIVDPQQGPEAFRPVVRAVIAESHQRRLRVAVHATELESARAAVEEGADVLVHSVDDKEVDEPFVRLSKEKGIILIPTLLVYERYFQTFGQRLNFLPIELETGNPTVISSLFDLRHLAADQLPERVRKAMEDPLYVESRLNLYKPALKNLKLLQDAGVLIAAGTDAGNIGTLHGPSLFREFERMAQAGLTPMQILATATVNGAKVFGPEANTGSIEPGRFADLVILRSDPLSDIRHAADVETVIKGGVLHPVASLVPESGGDLIQRQVNAYNARNVDAFLSTYADDAKLYVYPNQLEVSGRDQIRAHYERLFTSNPKLHRQIVHRSIAPHIVVDHERVTGLADKDPEEAVAIYEIKNGLIDNVRRIPALRADSK